MYFMRNRRPRNGVGTERLKFLKRGARIVGSIPENELRAAFSGSHAGDTE